MLIAYPLWPRVSPDSSFSRQDGPKRGRHLSFQPNLLASQRRHQDTPWTFVLMIFGSQLEPTHGSLHIRYITSASPTPKTAMDFFFQSTDIYKVPVSFWVLNFFLVAELSCLKFFYLQCSWMLFWLQFLLPMVQPHTTPSWSCWNYVDASRFHRQLY